jgi:HTH-like domain
MRRQQHSMIASSSPGLARFATNSSATAYRRVGAALRHQGIVVNTKKLRRLMREHDPNAPIR